MTPRKVRSACLSALMLMALASPPTVRAAGPQSLGGIVLEQVAPRIITPNGDNVNDAVVFRFDTSLAGVPFEANILDINGAHVANIEQGTTGTDPDSYLIWDGRDESGRVMPAGIYIYSIKIGKSAATGTVVVVR